MSTGTRPHNEVHALVCINRDMRRRRLRSMLRHEQQTFRISLATVRRSTEPDDSHQGQ